MKKYWEVLRACPLFQGIGDGDLRQMLTCLGAKVERFDKKQTIIAEGMPAKCIGIVLSGRVQIEQVDYYGNRSILNNVAPSELFAEAFTCAGVSAMPVAVIAVEPCEVMLIDGSHVLHTCERHCGFHQQLILNLMKDLAEKSLLFHQKLEIIGKRTTRDKLMTYLLHQAKKAECTVFTIPFDRQELADYLEVDRSGLSAEIGKLRKEGVLISRKNRFELL